jgi:hypothetical protein
VSDSGSKTRRVKMHITPELLEDGLNFDQDTKVVGCEWSWKDRVIELYLEGPQFREVAEGQEPPLVNPTLHQEAIRYEWNQ